MKPISHLLVCILAICLTTPLCAQSESSESLGSSPAKKKETARQVTEQRKTELTAFVDTHHPELKELLTKLEKRKKKKPYRQAMEGLDKAVKKLEGIKRRSPKRYESSLALWKIESRIKVAGAQVKLKDTEENRDNLKSLVTELVDFKIQQLKNDREQASKRLKQLETKIGEAEANRQQSIDKRIKSASRRKKKDKKKE